MVKRSNHHPDMGSMQLLHIGPDLALLLPDTTSAVDAFGLSTPASIGDDIRTYPTPKSNPLTVPVHNTTLADDSSPRASLRVPASHTTLLPHLIDLTTGPEGLVHAKHPIGRPKETSVNGPLKPSSCPFSDSAPLEPRGGPRNYRAPQTSTIVKRPVGSLTHSITPTDNKSTKSSSARPRTSFNGVYSSKNQTGHVSMQFGAASLVSALSSAFSQNAIQDSKQNRASAFASNSDNIEDDESSDSLSDPNFDSLPPKRRRRRIALKQVPQIPPVKRIRPKRTPKLSYAALSETTVTTNVEHLLEHFSVDLPLGVSIASENGSEYVDPDDEVLLDYDSSSAIIEERSEQEKLKTDLSPLALKNNLRFVLKEAHSRLNTRPIPRQYSISTAPSRAAYVQKVKEYYGDRALGSILDEILRWEATIIKPQNYVSPLFPCHMQLRKLIMLMQFRPQAPINDIVPESGSPEPLEISRAPENSRNAIPTKRSHPEDDLASYKKVKFTDTISEDNFQCSAAISGNSSDSHTNFDVHLCEELLQKLVKGKVSMSSQVNNGVILSFSGAVTVFHRKLSVFSHSLETPLSSASSESKLEIEMNLIFSAQTTFRLTTQSGKPFNIYHDLLPEPWEFRSL